MPENTETESRGYKKHKIIPYAVFFIVGWAMCVNVGIAHR
jgi:hypothetical protein